MIAAAYSSGGGGAEILLSDYTYKSGQAGGTNVDFTDASFDGGNTITNWLWDFGDAGATSALQNPSHEFTAGGTYTVTLTVTDDLLNTNATGRNIVITAANVAPTASFTSVDNLLEVTFTDTSTDPDGTITAWLWDFGD